MASALDRVRKAREAQRAEKSLTLPVPGWSGVLHVRYRPLEWEKTLDLMAAPAIDAKGALNANLDALVEGCDALLVKGDDGALTPLADELRAQGDNVAGDVRFDEYAVDALELEPAEQSARATCLAVFAGAVSPELAVAEHATRLGSWMRGAEEAVDLSLLGE